MDHVDEKKGSDYDLYHKTFSGAMVNAYASTRREGMVDKDDIDNKVATGPRKPSMGPNQPMHSGNRCQTETSCSSC